MKQHNKLQCNLNRRLKSMDVGGKNFIIIKQKTWEINKSQTWGY